MTHEMDNTPTQQPIPQYFEGPEHGFEPEIDVMEYVKLVWARKWIVLAILLLTSTVAGVRARRMAAAAICRSLAVRIAVPAAAPHNVAFALFRTFRIIAWTAFTIIVIIPVSAPLPDIAMHIVKSETVLRK